MRRTEFEQNDREVALQVLSSAKVGHLAYLREDKPEVLPYNFMLTRHGLEFHSSPKTGLASVVGQQVSFLAYDTVTWIPSTWRNPTLACPATTYYRSVTVKGTLKSLDNLEDKADSLGAFMQKYQPDDSYTPLHDPVYHGPLRALFVARLGLQEVHCKVKMGQHLTSKQRSKVVGHLRSRGLAGDRQACQAIVDANPDLQAQKEWREHLTSGQQESLFQLLSQSYWAAHRSRSWQHRNLEDSQVLVACCQGDQVLSFARVIQFSDFGGYLADVIVTPERRGNGLGKETMKRLLEHPSVRKLKTLKLATKDADKLYERLGFVKVRKRGDYWMMLKEQDPVCS